MGVVYHGHYVVYFEQGRTEYLRELGLRYRDVEEAGFLLVVTEIGVRYEAPARYDDLLTVRTRLTDVRRVRLRFEYELLRENTRLATGHTVLACTDPTGRPVRLPTDLAQRIASVGGPADGPRKSPPSGVQDRGASSAAPPRERA